MGLEEKTRLLKLLTETHSAIPRTVAGVDPELPVYPDSGWRIRDIVGHIATWDREVAKSLRAFRVGQEYVLPDHDEAAFNEQDILSQQELTSQQIFQEWELARKDFKEAIEKIPSEMFPGYLLYPWGDERGTMARHDVEHRDEIVKAIQSAPDD